MLRKAKKPNLPWQHKGMLSWIYSPGRSRRMERSQNKEESVAHRIKPCLDWIVVYEALHILGQIDSCNSLSKCFQLTWSNLNVWNSLVDKSSVMLMNKLATCSVKFCVDWMRSGAYNGINNHALLAYCCPQVLKSFSKFFPFQDWLFTVLHIRDGFIYQKMTFICAKVFLNLMMSLRMAT